MQHMQERDYTISTYFKNFSTGNKYTYSKVSLVLSEVLSVTERLNLKSNNVRCFFLGDIFFQTYTRYLTSTSSNSKLTK